MNEYEDKRFDEALRDKLSRHSSSLSRDLWSEISVKVDADDASDNARWKRWGWAGVILLLLCSGIALEFNRSISPVQVFFPRQEQTVTMPEEEANSSEVIQVSGQADYEPATSIPVLKDSEKISDEIEQPKKSNQAFQSSAAAIPEKIVVYEQAPYEPYDSKSSVSLVDELAGTQQELSFTSSFVESPETKESPETIAYANDEELPLNGDDGLLSEKPQNLEEESLGDIVQNSTTDMPEQGGTEPYTQAQEEVVADETLASLPLSGVATDEDELFDNSKKWTLELLIGPSVNYRTFNAESSPQLQSHKNENDRMMVSTSYAVMLNRDITERFSLSTGVFWLNTGERYEYTVNSATHSFTNHYDYVSIPLELHYLLWSKGDLGINAGAGIQYNMLKEGTSSWVDLASFQPVTHNNRGPESPFSEQAWAINAEIGICYVLNDRLDILLQERGTFFQESLYKEETGLDQRPYSFNTMLGIGMKF